MSLLRGCHCKVSYVWDPPRALGRYPCTITRSNPPSPSQNQVRESATGIDPSPMLPIIRPPLEILRATADKSLLTARIPCQTQLLVYSICFRILPSFSHGGMRPYYARPASGEQGTADVFPTTLGKPAATTTPTAASTFCPPERAGCPHVPRLAPANVFDGHIRRLGNRVRAPACAAVKGFGRRSVPVQV